MSWAEFCYNSSFQKALKTTPFQVVYGRPPSSMLAYEPGLAKVLAVDL
jgi:hypothetical protein